MANFPIDFPVYSIATERLVLDRVQSATESPYSKKVQVVHQASQWKLAWSWPRMRIPRAEVIAAWGLSLQGMVGSFKFYPNRTVTSALTGRTIATKAFATNNAVSVGGWAAGTLSTLRIGQWFTIGTQLLRVTEAAAVADASGRVTVTFEPALRADIAAGSAVEFVRPFGVFRLATTDSPAYTLDPDRAADFGTIEAREVV